MTSAPVKNANSPVNFMNAAGNVQPPKTGTDNSFGNVMDKASENNRNSTNDHQVTAAKRSESTKQTELSGRMKNGRKVSDVKGTENTASPEEQAMAVNDACQEMKNAIMETLQVSEEDVRQAMETLGLSMISLLDPANLSRLVLTLSGETDASSLLTNESLFGELQSLNEIAGQLRQDLMQMMDFSEDGPDTSLADTQGFMEMAMQFAEEGQNVDSQEEPGITVEVEQNGKSIELTTDSNGNVMDNGQAVTEKGHLSQNAGDHQQGEEKDGEQNAELQSRNLMLNNAQPDKVAATETGFTQNVTSFTQDTQEIMDQILNHMKIQLKPGMDSLQMQLHPESLGTVHVQLISKAGEVTAQFHVQNEAVKAAVESQMLTLKETLEAQGVKVEAVEVSVDTRGFESSLWQGGENPGQEAYEKQRRSPRRINLAQLDPSFEEEASEEDLLAAKMMEANGNTVDYTA